MEKEILSIKQKVKWLTLYAVISTCSALLFFMSTFSFNNNLIRTRGIIIEDSLGRDRILIGSPVPSSAERVRTDTGKVRASWAQRFGGDKYMKDYQSYSHEADGIIFLNEKGYDKLIVGEKMPDPNTGKRLVQPAGITFNDDEGFERGGLGVSKTKEGKYRVALGMDDPRVGEALHLFIFEDGTKALRIAYENGQILLGDAKANNLIFGNREEFSGLRILDQKGKVLWENNALNKKNQVRKPFNSSTGADPKK